MRMFHTLVLPGSDEFAHVSPRDRRNHILQRLESSSVSESSTLILLTGIGLFVSAYSLFSIALVIPILSILYYDGSMPHSYEVALNSVTLGGAFFGHLGFGFLADRYGRRKLGSGTLTLIIWATIGTAMSSTGLGGSMSFLASLTAWRFVLGVGIGGQVTLGAVMCAEFSPAKRRGRLLTRLLAFQPGGQLAACLLTLAVVSSRRDGILSRIDSIQCNPECLRTLDSTWRWIIGAAAIPTALAIALQYNIPESPRFLIDVKDMNSSNNTNETMAYLESQNRSRRRGRAMTDSMAPSSMVEVRLPSGAASEESLSAPDRGPLRPETSGSFHWASELEEELDQPDIIYASRQDFFEYFWNQGNWRTLVATSVSYFCTDLPYYGLLLNTPRISALLWDRTVQGSIYTHLMKMAWQSAISSPVGALIGCIIVYLAINNPGRRNIQMTGFFGLTIIFVVIGTTFRYLRQLLESRTAVMVVLYTIGQMFFAFGPSSTTSVLASELFPTRYRCLCHGISSATGKLGAIIAQIFLGYVSYDHGDNYNNVRVWLSSSVLVFCAFLVIGFVITLRWIPGAEHGATGEIKTLEEWSKGRDAGTNMSTGGNGKAKRWFHRFA